jgi:hypothetical protein
MSERKTLAANVAARLGTLRSQLQHDIRELEQTDYNPSTAAITQMETRIADDFYEVCQTLIQIRDMPPEPTPADLRLAEVGGDLDEDVV